MGGRDFVTHAIKQRRGTWLIDADKAKEVETKLIDKDSALTEEEKNTFKDELNDTPNFVDEFRARYQDEGYEIVGIQGCGNLSMNLWFVAFLNSNFTRYSCCRFASGRNADRTDHRGPQPRFIHILTEPYHDRVYTCLVKWKHSMPKVRRRYTVERLQFDLTNAMVRRAPSADGAKNDKQEENPENGRRKGIENDDLKDQIEFAVFGQQLVEDGQLVDFRTIAEQFADVRHLYKVPNINPDQDFSEVGGKRTGIPTAQAKRPRFLANAARDYHVWFGEHELTDAKNIDLLRHALTEPVILSTEVLGPDKVLVELAFAAQGYRKLDQQEPPRDRGSWRWYSEPQQIEIYLQRNVYPYSMLGLDADGNIIAAAADGKAGTIGQVLEGMAQNMIGAGCRQVLLVDEGYDVFQWVEGRYLVMPRRGRIRAVFLFARRKLKRPRAGPGVAPGTRTKKTATTRPAKRN